MCYPILGLVCFSLNFEQDLGFRLGCLFIDKGRLERKILIEGIESLLHRVMIRELALFLLYPHLELLLPDSAVHVSIKI